MLSTHERGVVCMYTRNLGLEQMCPILSNTPHALLLTLYSQVLCIRVRT